MPFQISWKSSLVPFLGGSFWNWLALTGNISHRADQNIFQVFHRELETLAQTNIHFNLKRLSHGVSHKFITNLLQSRVFVLSNVFCRLFTFMSVFEWGKALNAAPIHFVHFPPLLFYTWGTLHFISKQSGLFSRNDKLSLWFQLSIPFPLLIARQPLLSRIEVFDNQKSQPVENFRWKVIYNR